MPLVIGQATVPANTTVAVYTLPPGTMNTTLFQPTNPQAVYVGTSPHVSPTNGMKVPITPTNSESYVSAPGVTVYATTGNGTASSFSYIIDSGEF